MTKRRIVVLGSTGSIGTQTLDVVRQHGDQLEIVGLAVHGRVDELLSQAREFGVCHLAVGDPTLADDPRCDEGRTLVREMATASGADDASFGVGPEAVAALATLPEADVVVNALVGAAGLRASYDTLAAGKVLALANKESLVVGGDLIMPLAARASTSNAVPMARLRSQARRGRSCPSIPSTGPSTSACWARTSARCRSCG